ncbi:MAG: PQQ-dependent sugar dehydrogenase [Gammaproteobacteria bacterium]
MFYLRALWISVGLLWLAIVPVYANSTIALERVFENVVLNKPLAILQAPNKPNVWYVVEQAGRVQRLDGREGEINSTIFIDIRDRVHSEQNETGLLGMSFDPDFDKNGYVYLSYTRDNNSLESVLTRLVSGDKGKTLARDREQILFSIKQPFSNHNGGNIHFGPDGYLYYGLGDGGAGGDPKGNGQNKQTLLGAMLRIDVSGNSEYKIPKNNPFITSPGKAEIFAYGLRNPWRWSFDRKTGDLWVADVGQNHWEEVNLITLGGNYGWNLREGKHCFSGNCKQAILIDPIVEYSHDEGCSVTGGYVYRGKAIPSINGLYLYGDYCSGTIWGFDADKPSSAKSRVLLNTDLNISSFGEDNNGEIYVVDLKGKIFKFVKNKI